MITKEQAAELQVLIGQHRTAVVRHTLNRKGLGAPNETLAGVGARLLKSRDNLATFINGLIQGHPSLKDGARITTGVSHGFAHRVVYTCTLCGRNDFRSLHRAAFHDCSLTEKQHVKDSTR